jgi:haloalkane dehalogenase
MTPSPRLAPDAYRTPDERFEGLPGWPYAPRYATVAGLRMHFVEEGAGRPIVLFHGEPTWGFLYRKLVPTLVPAGRVLVPDLIGFGRSDKPLRPEAYTYDGHYAALERFALELDLREATLVVHDWSGPLGLRFAVGHPDRVDRLVLLNTGVGVGAPSPDWLRFRELVRRVGDAFSASRLVQASCVAPLDDAVLRAYDAPFPVAEAKAGARAFPELVPTEPDHPSAAAMLQVRDALARWEKPALVLFSDSDRVFSPEHAERLAAHIPGALPAEIVAGAGHFLQEDRGEVIAERIARFVGG